MAILERAGERLELMQRTHNVALVGMSDNPARASNFVATYLLGKTDWTIWFVNPRLDEAFGRPCYPSLAALPRAPSGPVLRSSVPRAPPPGGDAP